MCSGKVMRYYAVFSAIVGATATIGFFDFRNYFTVALCILYSTYSILWALDLYLLHQLVPNDSYDPQSEPCGSTCNATVLTVNYVETKTQRYRLLLLPVLGVMGSIGTFSYALYKSISEKEGIDGGSDYMSVIWSWMWFKIAMAWLRFGARFHRVGTPQPKEDASKRLIVPAQESDFNAPGFEDVSTA